MGHQKEIAVCERLKDETEEELERVEARVDGEERSKKQKNLPTNVLEID